MFDPVTPSRPQFGAIVAQCDARTAKPVVTRSMIRALVLAVVVATFIFVTSVTALIAALVLSALEVKGVGAAMGTLLLAFLLGGLAALLLGRFLRRKESEAYSLAGMTVYEGGIHLVTEVCFPRPINSTVTEFAVEPRWVSRSWRLLQRVVVKPATEKDRDFLTAKIQFTDGERVEIQSRDAGNTAEAIRQIVSAAGDRAHVDESIASPASVRFG